MNYTIISAYIHALKINKNTGQLNILEVEKVGDMYKLFAVHIKRKKGKIIGRNRFLIGFLYNEENNET